MTKKLERKKKKESMSRKKFAKALKTVFSATDKTSDVMQGTDSFIFSKGFIRAYNNQMAFSFPLETGLEVTVKAAETLRVTEKMSGNDIIFAQAEDCLEISDGRTRLRMTLIAEDEDIRQTLDGMGLEEIEWTKLPEDFLDAVNLCSYSVSEDDAMAMIAGIQVADGIVISSDNLRISRYKLKDGFEGSFTIPRDAVSVVLRLGNVEDWGRSPTGWVCFRTQDGVIFSTNELYEDFPLERLNEIMDGFEDMTADNEFPEGIEHSLDVVSVFSEVHDELSLPMVSIYKKGKKMVVESEREYGGVTDSFDFKGKFPDGRLFIAPDFLKTMLDVTRKFAVTNEGETVVFSTSEFIQAVTVISD